MKKLIVAAMLVLGATSAFAGDSDALKAVMKAKTYAEAEALLKQNLGQLANDAEKAKAYNKLVDLGMKAYNDQQSIMQTNQIMKKNDPIDENAMNEGAYNALMNAIECYKYDQLPNAKGKVAPKFGGNASRVWAARVQLVNAGQTAAQNNKADEVLKYWGAFLDTDSEPLFAGIDAKQKDGEKEYIGQVALFAARYAYQAKDVARCEKYCDIAMKSEKEAKDALPQALCNEGRFEDSCRLSGLRRQAQGPLCSGREQRCNPRRFELYVFFNEDGEGAGGASERSHRQEP